MSLAASLAHAIAVVRSRLADPLGRVVVLTPAVVSAELARRELGAEHDILDVRFTTPGRLVTELAELELALEGLTPYPAGWHRNRVEALLEEGAIGGRFARTLQAGGWAQALASLVRELEAAGVCAADLRGLPTTDDLVERCELAADLLSAMQRMAEAEGLASPGAVAAAAERAVQAGHPLAQPGGVVILGDARLPLLQHRALGAWISGRPVVRLALPDLEALPAEPVGLRSLAPEAETVSPVSSHGSGLRIELCATPDEVREASEIVRIVQAALAADPSLALDRIAIVLPDNEIVEPLAAALERAGVPATWQIGRPLSETPAGRFVGALLALHDHAPVADWYALLTEPGLRLSARLGSEQSQGRGRWRRLLSPLRHAASLPALLGAIERRIEVALTGGEEQARDLAALRGLSASLTAVRGIAAPLRSATTPGALAEALLPLLAPKTGWWRRAPDTARLTAALEALAQDRGRPTSYARAASTLWDAIGETSLLTGALTDRAVRVLEPMGTLGGSFDLVVLSGLVNGRFPRKPTEDPILPDAVRMAIEQASSITLTRSTDQPAGEQRRLAAVLSASRGRLVGLAARAEFSKGRPALLSPFARQLASRAAGRELGFAETERSLGSRGSRSGVPPEPEHALGSSEHLAARLRAGEPALGAALQHPATGPAMRRARALGRLRLGERTPELLPYLGVIPPELAPPEDGWAAPMPPYRLARLVADPEAHLLRRLGAYAPPSLRPGYDPANRYAVRDRLLAALSDVLATRRVTREVALAEASRSLVTELTELGHQGADDIVADAQRMANRLLGDPADLPPRPGLANPQQVDGDAPFVIEGGDGLPGPDGPIALVAELPAKAKLISEAGGVAFEALARDAQLTVRGLDDNAASVGRDDVGELRHALVSTAEAVQAGWFPSTDEGSSTFTSSRPPRFRLTDDVGVDWTDPEQARPVLDAITEARR